MENPKNGDMNEQSKANATCLLNLRCVHVMIFFSTFL